MTPEKINLDEYRKKVKKDKIKKDTFFWLTLLIIFLFFGFLITVAFGLPALVIGVMFQ